MLQRNESMSLLVENNEMKRKILKLILLFSLIIICCGIALFFGNKELTLASSVVSSFVGFLIPNGLNAAQDLMDTANWKTSERKLIRGKFIKGETLIRISFAYLYRIKVNNNYLLVKNARGTGKYQPVGGVYKMLGSERIELKNLYHVVDDDKVPLDKSSKDDYRLQLPCKYLRRFVRRFNSPKASRERIDNVSREFKEELGDVITWNKIEYRYCGRHMTDLKYSDHFQCYELLLADVVELLPTDNQIEDLKKMMLHPSDYYHFATTEEIKNLGVVPGTEMLQETIADHSQKILQENEQNLMKEPHVKEIFSVSLNARN